MSGFAIARAVTPPDSDRPFAERANAIEFCHPVRRSFWRRLLAVFW